MVGCAFAVVWQVEHFVAAAPPSNRVVPDVPWHAWQFARFFLASRPWNAELVGSAHAAPVA